MSVVWATRLADRVIADNREIVTRYQRDYGVTPDYISYGCQLRPGRTRAGELESWGLAPDRYILHVSRLSPENEADLLLEAWKDYRGPLRLVITGSHHYERTYYDRLLSLADDRVIFTGARFSRAYVELSQNALFFVMPAAIEATRLVLLDQMAMGKAILFKDSPATREVVGEAAEAFDPDRGAPALTERLEFLSANPAHCEELGALAYTRAVERYSWDAVLEQYRVMFNEVLPCRRSP
jgi:glycosyltransferase involved in cell wall biosynthesis